MLLLQVYRRVVWGESLLPGTSQRLGAANVHYHSTSLGSTVCPDLIPTLSFPVTHQRSSGIIRHYCVQFSHCLMDFGYASLGEVKCSRSRTGGVISKYVTSLVSPTGLKKIHGTWNMSWAVFLIWFFCWAGRGFYRRGLLRPTSLFRRDGGQQTVERDDEKADVVQYEKQPQGLGRRKMSLSALRDDCSVDVRKQISMLLQNRLLILFGKQSCVIDQAV